ncbi:hypothetical protein [Streptomyces yangpuensis]|uniref:hypothetical protein n=1 Tax=Streptomyces yangpuensis TaxID=1648182 RepID=UPI003806DA40
MRTTAMATLTLMAATITITSTTLLFGAAPAHAAAPPPLDSRVDTAVAVVERGRPNPVHRHSDGRGHPDEHA